MKYAIVENGGKQYKTVVGGSIEVDRLNLEIGKKVILDQVLLVSDPENHEVFVGSPTVGNTTVEATVIEHLKGKKVVVFKYKPKIRYRVKTGHRQLYTRIKIEAIKTKKASKSSSAE